jgi:hypothetical protein
MKSYILSIGMRITIPLSLGLILFLIMQQTIYLQLSFFVFAMFGLMVWLGKFNHLDRKNMKAYGSTKVDKTSTDFLSFRKGQRIVLYSSLLNIAFSYLIFYIFGG